MIQSYLPVVIFFALAMVFLAGSFLASTLLGPKRRTMAKTASYECGIVPENDTQRRFGVKFYLLAIAFIILDVEIVFLYPFATVFIQRNVNGVDIAGLGSAGLAVMGIFIFILLIPFAYLLSSGALNFGPKSPKISSMLAPIIRSQGFVSNAGLVGNSERTFAGSFKEGSETESEGLVDQNANDASSDDNRNNSDEAGEK